MDKYLSHFSAAYEYYIPYLSDVIGMSNNNRYKSGGEIDITVQNQNEKHKKKGVCYHVSYLPLPKGAVIKRNGRLIASPELVFLQLANELDIHRLILLGLQLCSHPPGKPSHAVTTKENIKNFLVKTAGHNGYIKAVRALKYIENGSASLMESILYMILTLPHTLGGFGLSGACFNHEVLLNAAARKQLKKGKCFIDIFYADEKIAVEYDSLMHHGSAEVQGRDAKRESALELQGIDVLRMVTIQLYNTIDCEVFCRNLASRLKRRIQIRTKKFQSEHKKLRLLLPTKASNKSAN